MRERVHPSYTEILECIDRMRCKWMKIHYCSRENTLNEENPNETDNIPHLHRVSIKIISRYLRDQYSGEPEYKVGIDSDWLMAWMTMNILKSRKIIAKIQQNPIAFRRFYEQLSHQILYILHCIRFFYQKEIIDFGAEDSEGKIFYRPPFADVFTYERFTLSEAQIFLLSEYAYEEIGIPRDLPVYNKLCRQMRNELPLYASEDFYRDHLYHVMDVCLLGEFLIRTFFTQRRIGKPTLFFRFNKKKSMQELLINWYIAALCHDLGYVVEYTSKFLRPVGEIKGQGLDLYITQLSKALKDGERVLQKYLEENLTLPDDVKEILKNSEKVLDHGVISYLHLLDWTEARKTPSDQFQPALNAILRHNLHGQKINCGENPLAFLLLLCDHIQEWGRPRVGPELLAKELMEGMRFSREAEFDRRITMDRIELHGIRVLSPKKRNTEECRRCMASTHCTSSCFQSELALRSGGIDFILSHSEATHAGFEPVISWLLMTRDFQAFSESRSQFLFPLRIRMDHIPSRYFSFFNWSILEMDLLEEFARTNEGAAYLNEWIDDARAKRNGIEYNDEARDRGEEYFILNLHKMNNPLSRGLEDSHWEKFMQWKKGWMGEKFLQKNIGSWFIQ